jgi:hypothetical protein
VDKGNAVPAVIVATAASGRSSATSMDMPENAIRRKCRATGEHDRQLAGLLHPEVTAWLA